MEINETAPAKVNLLLAVHGPRDDGFHDLTSLVVQSEFGDRLFIAESRGEEDSLSIEGDIRMEADAGNLVLRAARAFREKTGSRCRFAIRLEKSIPIGAGLGGGSSDAMAALRGMERITGVELGENRRLEIGASLGSDCNLFVDPAPKVIRGRGEILERLGDGEAARLSGRRLILLKPPLAIPTGWAYGALRANREAYISSEVAEERLEAFRSGGGVECLLTNSFEAVALRKFLGLRIMVEEARRFLGVAVLMSGSGSAVFALPGETIRAECFRDWIEEQFAGEGFFIETRVL